MTNYYFSFFIFYCIETMTTSNSNKWLYVIKPNTSENAKTKFIASLVLMTAEWQKFYKENIGKKPMSSLYKNYIKFNEGKNTPKKQYCLAIDEPEFLNDIKSCMEWNETQLEN